VAEEEQGEKKVTEIKETREEKVEVKKVEESAEDDDLPWYENKWVVGALIWLVGIIIGYYILPKIVELLRERQEQDMYMDYWPEMPPPVYYDIPPSSSHLTPVASPPIHRPKSAIDPLMHMRTPESLRRHGIYLDEKGEAILMDATVYETWTIERDGNGKIINAFPSKEMDELEYDV
jgi:hypothetical protein